MTSVDDSRGQNDASGNGDSDLQGNETCLGSHAQLVGDELVGRPDDTASRHQGDDSTDEEDRDRAVSQPSHDVADGCHGECGKKGCAHYRMACRHKQVNRPASHSRQTAIKVKTAGCTKESRETYRAHEGSNQLDCPVGSHRILDRGTQLDYAASGDTVNDKSQGNA